ncbi:HAMP domain-containing sensor histidine kinase [uncultured Rhodoblastus sp.]|uniref:sensor histidine kinase n=1 Tax=uncultured Rhodoblastus sp. TaxID=543037 RepID=UPI0025FD58D9|nr:HAMP domain-containing sensor histidine kinase [uncultured Rhodoblastus sp.]
MSEVTAEMIARGRFADGGGEQRRLRANGLREARESLTSARAGDGVHDLALLRLHAEGRKAALLPQALLCLAIAAMTHLWLPPLLVAVWFGVQSCAALLAHWEALRLLRLEKSRIGPRGWRARFILAEAANGVGWGLFAVLMIGVADPWATTYVMVVLMLASAFHTVVAALLPAAVHAALAPMALGLLFYMRPTSFYGPVAPMTLLALGALLCFVALARRIYFGQLDSLAFQAEKDHAIGELEQAKAISDEARRRAEEASLAKSRFLATMSHELRTPLNAILGFSEVMEAELFGRHAVEVYRDYSRDIHSSGAHLLTLINEILDLSRVEAGRYELREEAVLLSGIVEDCRRLLDLRAGKRGVIMDEIVEPDMPRIWADERALRQIALNLLTNAIKFTPQGGKVQIKIGWTLAGGQYFAIKDNGPGIPEDEIPVILSSFGRGSMAQKNADEGAGLGLPIVKALVELHGGVFNLRSKLREGTEAIVVFPPERVMNALPHLDPDAPEPRKSIRRRLPRNAA